MRIITNSLGSGDYIFLLDKYQRKLFEGHSISPHDLLFILKALNIDISIVEVTDEQLEVY